MSPLPFWTVLGGTKGSKPWCRAAADLVGGVCQPPGAQSQGGRARAGALVSRLLQVGRRICDGAVAHLHGGQVVRHDLRAHRHQQHSSATRDAQDPACNEHIACDHAAQHVTLRFASSEALSLKLKLLHRQECQAAVGPRSLERFVVQSVKHWQCSTPVCCSPGTAMLCVYECDCREYSFT